MSHVGRVVPHQAADPRQQGGPRKMSHGGHEAGGDWRRRHQRGAARAAVAAGARRQRAGGLASTAGARVRQHAVEACPLQLLTVGGGVSQTTPAAGTAAASGSRATRPLPRAGRGGSHRHSAPAGGRVGRATGPPTAADHHRRQHQQSCCLGQGRRRG